MNLHQFIRRDYGQNAVIELRNKENIEKKISRFRNHRVFTLRCKDQGLTPPSLRLKCPINTHNARQIVQRAEKQLLRERIRVINHKLTDFNLQNTKGESDLISRDYPNNVQQRISRHLEKSRETEFQNVRARQQKKLDRDKTKTVIKQNIISFYCLRNIIYTIANGTIASLIIWFSLE